jgi:predicted Zn-dependent protease
MEKTKPGVISKVFSSHPMTTDRIEAAQKEIQDELKPQPEYVLDTSEFHDVKNRLAMIENRRKGIDDKDSNRPTLRHRESDKTGSDSDDRPTLKRRD